MNVIFVLAKMTANKVDLVLRNLGEYAWLYAWAFITAFVLFFNRNTVNVAPVISCAAPPTLIGFS